MLPCYAACCRRSGVFGPAAAANFRTNLLRTGNLSDRVLRRIDVPTLLISSAKDRMLPSLAEGEWLPGCWAPDSCLGVGVRGEMRLRVFVCVGGERRVNKGVGGGLRVALSVCQGC